MAGLKVDSAQVRALKTSDGPFKLNLDALLRQFGTWETTTDRSATADWANKFIVAPNLGSDTPAGRKDAGPDHPVMGVTHVGAYLRTDANTVELLIKRTENKPRPYHDEVSTERQKG